MPKLLIVEDDPFVRRYYNRLFSRKSYQVEMAATGQEGIDKAKEYKPDLILLDIMMPVVNGIQILEKLKQDPETKDFQVVMLTVLGDEATIKKTAELGSIGYIIKSSIEPDELLKIVEGYLVKIGKLPTQ
ncbi:hypothetical protein A2154_03670 [Candidatus Gottesmanbacteria bacterium RBG_16_43_7]|uniref:Response regulatory domain-containing protein n=1 Tax=Candidatus Gottesmanbacteria bacterium RBG_16_43_7 TaxID=1798373 RepID=A0A1F5Z9E0_9BACT|nr:MAG: hypothetical protein A2154_03670 [Candidatus Gottesmanbacteria bacterium RBG_16_43_7]